MLSKKELERNNKKRCISQLIKRKTMKKDFKEKTVVITGASAGLGRAMVREFEKRWANSGLIARGEDGLNTAKKEAKR